MFGCISMLSAVNQLNANQLTQLESLRTLCSKIDGSAPNYYPHLLAQSRPLQTTLFYTEKTQLKGFLSVYFFYENAVEIALFVSPTNRKQGIARSLLQNILPLVKQNHYKQAIFSSPLHFNDQWFIGHGFHYQHSEYYMERNLLNPLLNPNQSLTYRNATIDDIPSLCQLDNACFDKTASTLNQRFHQLLSERNYQIVMAFDKEQCVGKVHIRWQDKGATFSDIAVFPEFQGKGLGTALISYCINFALSEGKPNLNLDVETHNQKALNLYTRLGFTTQNACDYWQIDLSKLEILLNKKESNSL